ncbi:MAG: hypothetical protein KJP00_10045 [Bacteroidia bacterium]|nr:hypothetical protein [Bacteroidia bacterium]
MTSDSPKSLKESIDQDPVVEQLSLIEEKQDSREKLPVEQITADSTEQKSASKKEQKESKKNKSTDPVQERKERLASFDRRGIQTLFRTLSRNHYHLLRMIDAKARIILFINSIIISLLKGAIFFAPEAGAVAASLGSSILVNCCMISMVFAAISMLPHRYFSRQLRGSGYRGSLYAANIAQQNLDEFREEIYRIMTSGQLLYDEMIKDIFFLSKAIKSKQQLLIFAFGIFLIGILATLTYSLINGFGNLV